MYNSGIFRDRFTHKQELFQYAASSEFELLFFKILDLDDNETKHCVHEDYDVQLITSVVINLQKLSKLSVQIHSKIQGIHKKYKDIVTFQASSTSSYIYCTFSFLIPCILTVLISLTV